MSLRFFLLMIGALLIAAPLIADDAKDKGDREARRRAWLESLGVTPYQAPAIQQLQAKELAHFEALEAGQGAALDAKHFYAVVNFAIGKYERAGGALIGRWAGTLGGPIAHLNSCYAAGGELLCANSNFPETPMASSVEIFRTRDMTHVKSHSLGVMEEGSLTWFDKRGDGWVAGFAHYDAKGGLPYKDHSYASVVSFDEEWRRTGGWLMPESVTERMAPHAASGGALGGDGRLYLMGHDRPEMYVLEFPEMGPALRHVATIAIDAEGQAFAFDRSRSSRAGAPQTIAAISRKARQVRLFELPAVD
ncbi:MAG: hypothetical protein AAF869_10110 [Pseudomonadota bacterium]